jgi:2C-methyl-D-erythritol 2,4-cyclodiphosphate synthase
MRGNIALALDVAHERVSVKATTGEQMGFVGRGEGAAAFAVALLLWQ